MFLVRCVYMVMMWPAWILMGIPIYCLAKIWCDDFPKDMTIKKAKEGFFKPW